MRERVRQDGRRQDGRRACGLARSIASACASSRRRRKALGLRNGEFTIFDQGDVRGGRARDLAHGARWQALRHLGHRGAHLARQEQLSGKTAIRSIEKGTNTTRSPKMVWPKYRAALRGFQAFDFDDLVCEPVRLWRRRADVLARWQERFRYVMVDEYQDTNHAQLETGAPLGERAPQHVRRRRRRPIDLRVARRRSSPTFSISNSTSRAPKWSSSSRTIARRQRCSRSPTRCSRTPRLAGTRRCCGRRATGADRQPGHRARSRRRGVVHRRRDQAPLRRGSTATARWPSSTARTSRASPSSRR